MIRLTALASACLFAVVHIPSVAGPIEDAQAKGLAWLVQTQRGDGSFAGLKGLEVQSTAGAVEAMLAGIPPVCARAVLARQCAGR